MSDVRPFRILLLVSDPDLDALLRDFLPQQGFVVIGALTQEEQQSLVARREIDAAIAECDGHSNPPALLASGQVPTLAITGMAHSREAGPAWCRRALTKPASMRRIVDELNELLGRDGHQP